MQKQDVRLQRHSILHKNYKIIEIWKTPISVWGPNQHKNAPMMTIFFNIIID